MRNAVIKSVRTSVATILCALLLTSGVASAAPNVGSNTTGSSTSSVSNSSFELFNNWSGYAVTGHNYNQVRGDFVVPTVSCTVPNATALFWVGFDGYYRSTHQSVEQVGIVAQCSSSSRPTPHYYAFWEMYPTVTVQPISSLHIVPGEKIHASVNYVSNEFQLKIGIGSNAPFVTYRTCGAGYACRRVSAEWITERWMPNINNSKVFSPLARWNNNNDSFTSDYAATNTSTVLHPISYFNNTQIDMGPAAQNPVMAEPSGLYANGTSFVNTWYSAQ